MTPHPLPASYARCREITRAARSNFPLAFRLLPAAGRRAMGALYAFLRVTDDLADEPGEAAAKRGQLNAWRRSLVAALGGTYSHPVHPALHDTVRRYDIPPEYLLAVIDGVESDLEPVRFATFADLVPYCYRVASVVGLACVRVWGLRPGATWEEAEEPAVDAGIAFQLTNILRDLGEDLSRGRVYLPQEDLNRFGCPPDSWRDPKRADGFRAMARFQADRARDYYRRGDRLDRLLSADGRAVFRVMSGFYRALLDEIGRRDYDVFAGRVRVPRWRKAVVLLSAWPAKWGWV
jgi:phytoene synthase